MPMSLSQYLIEPEELSNNLDNPNYLIVDICDPMAFFNPRIPGASIVEDRVKLKVSLPKSALEKSDAMFQIKSVLEFIGYNKMKKIVVYDDASGLWSSYFIWLLECIGHNEYAILNGGLDAWIKEGYPVTSDRIERIVDQKNETKPLKTSLKVRENSVVRLPELLKMVGRPNVIFWDPRTKDEYSGEICRSERPGHIPGAIRLEWFELIDAENGNKFVSDIHSVLLSCDISRNSYIVIYCYGNLRSSLCWLAAKIAGYSRVRVYAGGWNEWGNIKRTPVKTGSKP